VFGISFLDAQTAIPLIPGNLVQNPGFELALPAGNWALAQSVAARGIGGNSIFGVHSGRHSLRLVPNTSNKTFFDGGSFGFGQVLDFSGTRGKPLYFGGWLSSEGGAIPIIRVLVELKTGELFYRQIRVPGAGTQPARVRDIMDVPDSDQISVMVLDCEAEGTGGSAFFDDIFATTQLPTDWKAAMGEPDPGDALIATVAVQADHIVRQIPPEVFGQNMEYIYDGNGIWDASQGQLNPDMVRLGQGLGSGILRFPGGFFADAYHWRDGVGPPGLRPITLSQPGGNYSDNGFGTDEALAYADAIGSKLLITVNARTGTPQEAADWVRYVNNGTRHVDYWEVGNELYVDLSTFDPNQTAIGPEQYANIYLAFASAMRAADPTIKIGAILDFKYSEATYRPFPDWADKVLRIAGSQIDFVAVHNAFAPAVGLDAGWNLRTVDASMLAAPLLVMNSLADLSKKIDSVLGPDGAKIQVAITEWAPLYATDLTSRFLDHPKTLASAIYCASILKAIVESPRTLIGNAFKLVDALELSWIGIRNGSLTPKAPYYAMQLFTQHFGPALVSSQTVSPGYEARSIGWIDAVPFVPYLETLASKSSDGNSLYIIGINKHFDRNIEAKINWQGFCAQPNATAWNLDGNAIDANTGTQLYSGINGTSWAPQATDGPDGRFYLGGPGEIWVDQIDVQASGSSLDFYFPAHSVTAIQLTGVSQACAAN
jgi:alpha-N-arabinofuranosidase